MDAFAQLKAQIDRLEGNDAHIGAGDIEKCFAKTFSTMEGKQALRYLTDLFVDTQTFVPGDPQYTAYNLGHADLVNFIKDCVKAAKGVDNEEFV
jgi:hypothetical protein